MFNFGVDANGGTGSLFLGRLKTGVEQGNSVDDETLSQGHRCRIAMRFMPLCQGLHKESFLPYGSPVTRWTTRLSKGFGGYVAARREDECWEF